MGPQGLSRLHAAGLRILEETGFVFRGHQAVGLFASRGFRVDGVRVYMTADQVMAAVSTVPRSFTLAARARDRDLVFGGGDTIISNAGGASCVAEEGRLRQATMDDLVRSLRLCHVLDNVDLVGYSLAPVDWTDPACYAETLCRAMCLTDKPLEYPVAELRQLPVVLQMAEILFGGDWHDLPRTLVVLNSTSPLQLDESACTTILELARRHQPLTVTPCVMGGTTGPASLAGILALQHAETLAGLVLAQLAGEGCPCLYSGFSSVASMRTGDLLFGVPEFWALMATTVDLGHFLGLPCKAGGAVTDSHVVDMQAGVESALGLAAVMQKGVDFVLNAVGAISSGNGVSWEKMVIDDAVVGLLRAALQEIPVDDDDLSLEVIDAVGPGGNFLSQAHTRRHSRGLQHPALLNRLLHDGWSRAGGQDSATVARQKVEELLASSVQPSLDSITARQLETYCESL